MSDTESVGSQGEALLRGSAPSANMFEETVERLGHSIKLGLIKPGQQLPPERELAELIGVSRVTVRSALQVLVQGGFLIAKRGRNGGTFVVDHPPVWNGTNSERPNSQVSASDAAISDDVSALLMRGIGTFSHANLGAYSPYITGFSDLEMAGRIGRLAKGNT